MGNIAQHQLRQGTPHVRWQEPWLVGGEQSWERRAEMEAKPRIRSDLTMTMVRGSRLLVTMQTCLL